MRPLPLVCRSICVKAKQSRPSNHNTVHCNTLITKHGRAGNIPAAESVFSRMPFKTTVSWTAMLTAYADNGQIENARKLFGEMPHRTTASYNAMITAYLRNGVDARRAFLLFSKIPNPDAVSYAATVTCLVRAGMLDLANELHSETPLKYRDPVCSNALLNGYLKMGALDDAVRVFEGMEQRNVVSFSSMIDGYCKRGALSQARDLFDKMPERNAITWTAMIDGYMQMGLFEDGFLLFLCMRWEEAMLINPTTLTVVLEACTDSESFPRAEQTHGLVILLGFQSDVFLCNSLIKMYCRFGSAEAAEKIFHALSTRDVVTWNSLIAGYAQSGDVDKAYRLFREMPLKDVVSWTTMIAGFSNCGLTRMSVELFEMMPVKDDIAWTALISSLVTNEECEEAFSGFINMLRCSIRPNPLALSSILIGLSRLASLNQGLQVHALALKMELEYDVSIQNSLISMYSKCGNMKDAYNVFLGISVPNLISYNSIIAGLSQNGFGKEALQLFNKMHNVGQSPNEVSFLAVLSACCHAGLVDEGWHHFRSMKSLYGIEPMCDHYACMVDLLGRAGLLEEATCLIRSMPLEPHAGVWGALLSASKTYSRLDLAELAARNLMTLQPDNATPYVVLSSLYDISEKPYVGDSIRMVQKSKGVRKNPGCSWITVKDEVHMFLAGDKSHPDVQGIEATLSVIAKDFQMRQSIF